VRFDDSGKVSFDHIYTAPDPRDYFRTLYQLDYRIPQLAKPYFTKLIEEYREARGVPVPTVLDIGCSYGVNAALVKCDITMEELYERYRGKDSGILTRDALLAADRALTRSSTPLDKVRFIGLDSSRPALTYALSAGFLDDAVHADLERSELTEDQRQRLVGLDLVISTGCIGYITQKTLSRIVQANGGHKPWMAHFVLRMFPFGPMADTLHEWGYDTVRIEGVFKQRRFASAVEQSFVLDTLSTIGVDPVELETDGWLYAQLFVSRPRNSVASLAVADRVDEAFGRSGEVPGGGERE
jgi:SAM-dependent methyltransferase